MSQFSIEYGIENNYSDVTNLALNYHVHDTLLSLPAGDCNRAAIFGDPIMGILKHIRITKNGKSFIYPDDQFIHLDVSNVDISKYQTIGNSRSWYDHSINNATAKLELIHKNVKFIGGNIRDEYPEQLMAVMFVSKDAKVLELGSNIGRNTLTIATILTNQNNLVTLECDPNTCKVLRRNMEINGYDFHIEDSALSYRKLIQRGWDTIPSDEVLAGYVPVKCITFQQLEAKYRIRFDTIVADCEGALYYMLSDYPNMLDNIKTLIMENDYHDIHHKNILDDIIKNKGFTQIYVRGGGWGPCFGNFYEVWQK